MSDPNAWDMSIEEQRRQRRSMSPSKTSRVDSEIIIGLDEVELEALGLHKEELAEEVEKHQRKKRSKSPAMENIRKISREILSRFAIKKKDQAPLIRWLDEEHIPLEEVCIRPAEFFQKPPKPFSFRDFGFMPPPQEKDEKCSYLFRRESVNEALRWEAAPTEVERINEYDPYCPLHGSRRRLVTMKSLMSSVDHDGDMADNLFNSYSPRIASLRLMQTASRPSLNTILEDYPNRYVVMGANSNPEYLFPLIMTVKRWKFLGNSFIFGFRSIVCFGSSKEELYASPASQLLMKSLEKDEVQMMFFNSTLAPSHTLSQTCRLFVTGSPVTNFSPDDLVITSDGDLWPIDLRNHIPRKGQDVFGYHTHCCGFIHKPWYFSWFRHYQMSTIAMKVKDWREVIGIYPASIINGDILARRLFDEFSEKYIKYGRPTPHPSRSWFADQILLSDKLNIWKQESIVSFGEIPFVLPKQRLSKDFWPENFDGLVMSKYKEVHLPSGAYSNQIFPSLLKFMDQLFDPQSIAEIKIVREQFLKLYGQI